MTLEVLLWESGGGFSSAGVVASESTAAKRSKDSKVTVGGAWIGSSEGMMKSPGSTEEVSAPPKTWPSCSTAVFCQIRALWDFLSGFISMRRSKLSGDKP